MFGNFDNEYCNFLENCIYFLVGIKTSETLAYG